MSLLEDVFLQDEANEAEELERVIEGDEFEERRRSDSDDNSEKEDEAEEDKRRVDPAKAKPTRVVKNPRFLLNPARLTGPRGIQVIPEHFKDFKFKGKGHEKEDLDLVLKRLEHWAYRLYPKFQFEDCLKKIETLGKKRPVAVHLHKIRSDQFLSEDTVVQKDSSDDDMPAEMPPQEDEFDKLLQQQIDLARSTPAPNSAKKPEYSFSSTKDKRTTSIMMPKATSSPSISDEQRERMLRSRKLAEERRLARLKNAVNTNNTIPEVSSQLVSNEINSIAQNSELNTEQTKEVNEDTDKIEVARKHNRSNVIDSSDDETGTETHVSIAVDVHNVKDNVAINNTTPEEFKNSHDNDGDSSDSKGSNHFASELDELTNDKLSKDINSTESTEKTAEDIIEMNGVHENNEKSSDLVERPLYTKITEAVENTVDNSGENEELRYDDSDMNIGDGEHNVSDQIAEENVLRKLPEKDSNVNNVGINSEEFEVTKDSVEEERTDNKENNLSENVLDDVMDVDFSDDF